MDWNGITLNSNLDLGGKECSQVSRLCFTPVVYERFAPINDDLGFSFKDEESSWGWRWGQAVNRPGRCSGQYELCAPPAVPSCCIRSREKPDNTQAIAWEARSQGCHWGWALGRRLGAASKPGCPSIPHRPLLEGVCTVGKPYYFVSISLKP